MNVTIPYDVLDMAVREVGNGIWTCLSAALMIGFLRYAFLHRRDYNDPTLYGAIALAVYFAGSMMRNAITWGSIVALLRGWPMGPWIDLWPWHGVSILLGIFGAAWGVWIFSPIKYRGPAMCAAVALSLALPIAVRVFV